MGRKKPFSHKQKKHQLQEKKSNKRLEHENEHAMLYRDEIQSKHMNLNGKNKNNPLLSNHGNRLEHKTINDFLREGHDVEELLKDTSRTTHNRLNTFFKQDDPMESERKKLESREPLKLLPKEALEVRSEDFYYEDGKFLDMPKRPSWDYTMGKEQFDENEKRSFKSWVQEILNSYSEEKLSYFELNLEVWRQLWRTIEMSDVILLITDIRHPIIHFPPALYYYVVEELRKPLVLIFNKIDLVSDDTLTAWKEYFASKFPKLHIVAFSCYPFDRVGKTEVVYKKVKRTRSKTYKAIGVCEILRACSQVQIRKHGILVDWESLIKGHLEEEFSETLNDNESEFENVNDAISKSPLNMLPDKNVSSFDSIDSLSSLVYEPDKNYITIGFVGQPNVGKSSIINGIMGKKVVSTSRTPGHTKHFQTIHLTANVRLCDCPGLVFPSFVPKSLQILAGVFPIAQVHEPYSVVHYLTERVCVQEILQLKHPDQQSEETPFTWSAWHICEAYAHLRGFFTARTARLDVYRAANHLLRMAADGKIILSFKPMGFYVRYGASLEPRSTSEVNWLIPTHSNMDLNNVGLSSPSNDSCLSGETNSNGSGSSESLVPVSTSGRYSLLDMEDG